jgi:hypothetical protein
MGEECSMHGEKRNAYKNMEGKQKGKKPLRKCGCICKDNIKRGLRDVMGDSRLD